MIGGYNRFFVEYERERVHHRASILFALMMILDQSIEYQEVAVLFHVQYLSFRANASFR